MLLLLCLVFISVGAQAHLRPLSDRQLSSVTGQAFVTMDRYQPAGSNLTYERVNLGMDIGIQTNIQKLDLGHYNRTSEAAGSSDVLVNNFGLGYIQNSKFFSDNPGLPQQLKSDGSSYQNGDIVPFQIKNPYLEFAYNQHTQNIVGMRLGFGQAEGILSGTIATLTGNVNVNIVDHGEGMKYAQSQGNLVDQVVADLTPYLASGSPLTAQAVLVHGNPNDPQYGEPDPIRAQYIGVPNGHVFKLTNVNNTVRGTLAAAGLLTSSQIKLPGCTAIFCGWPWDSGEVDVIAQNCAVLGVQACFKLSNYHSFPIGKITKNSNSDTAPSYLTGPSNGLFMSFETQPVKWLKNLAKENSATTAADFVAATTGAFLNIPNSATTVNLKQAIGGIPRYQSEYIDRGVGLF